MRVCRSEQFRRHDITRLNWSYQCCVISRERLRSVSPVAISVAVPCAVSCRARAGAARKSKIRTNANTAIAPNARGLDRRPPCLMIGSLVPRRAAPFHDDPSITKGSPQS
jgi:hypothetical protein